jgi:cell division protein FtsQ
MSTLAARLALPLRRPLRAVTLSPRLRRRLLVALAACALLSGAYLLWFRDSGLVRVRKVSVRGLTAADAGSLRRALTVAARGMTTLHLDRERLARVAALYPVVQRLELSADFPHTLRIRVIERRAAAMAVSGRSRVPVAADGSLLRGLPVSGALPVVTLRGPAAGDRLRDRAALVAVRVTGAAPPDLLRRLRGVWRAPRRGIVVSMRRGPDLVFCDTSRLRAKWAAVARVLADPGSRGATYLDVRLPERPAAGGLSAGAAHTSPQAGGVPSRTQPGSAGPLEGAPGPIPGTAAPGTGAPQTAPQPTATGPGQAFTPPTSGAPPAAPTGPTANSQP